MRITRMGYYSTVALLVMLLQACASSVQTGKISSEKAAQFNAQLGIKYMRQQGDLEQARIKLEKALSQDSRNALAHAGYAQLQSRVGDNTLAEKHYKRAIVLEPLNGDHQNAYGVFLCGDDRVAEAITAFDAAVENRYYKTPEYALDNAGICLLDAERPADAERYLAKAIKAKPDYSPALLNLADLNLRAERMELALAYYRRYATKGRETPRSLWIGFQVYRSAGRLDEAQQLSDTLLQKYPNSFQAGELLTSTVND